MTMSHLLLCDAKGCDESIPTASTFGEEEWLVVKVLRGTKGVLSEELHFCSRACFERYRLPNYWPVQAKRRR